MPRTHLNSYQLGKINNNLLDTDLESLGDLTSTGALVRTAEGHIDTTQFWGCQDADLQSLSISITTNDQIVLDSYALTVYNALEYFFIATMNDDVHSTKFVIINNSTDMFITEYATIISNNSLFSIDANIINNSAKVFITSLMINPIQLKAVRISIKK